MIMMANETAILFDHRTESVTPVSFDGELKTLRILLRCKMIDTIRLDSDHIIIVDDESFLNKVKTGFALTYKGHRVEFAGSGLLTGDSYGQSAPITLDLPDLKIDVLKFEYEA
jgi:hypothetical protein